ncbi:MAG: hypothetical protein ACD_38C00047G0004 [uncultured bacterium]|uniref:Uncharacterized protein n=2 Tax=Microgenomates group TaxID=1794810 RepID=A0A0G0T3Z6_9BACT|nr:MAG: hypothetical protein ACD_38C00047G0004 [uncultured bacterium]KKQ75813.1 MAG: hypothetical protein US96_C0004G0036 [Candidatus Woesebacteria bacterium GW2011_GWB1_38_5b]KKQ81140.1 MAG: hypothetical protein UT04_C0081G0005 [Candidatus Daviesbacteria bacterium GW2011_GWF2_38_7]KKR16555.1 MAG: hypothetical protein UT45_C0005G0084 [Candidatus Daviesbacteria bacterium GW2011_GWA2_39_33]KKR41820.1 MAG: hypothetical protein UT77_C0006G0052 [Candidatus Daviesbacteria bacterium GW2011_GWC2_40_12]
MNTIRVSATAARNKFFELLNQVALGTQVIIERDSKEVAVLSPKKKTVDWVALRKASKAVRGIWKDYDEKDNPLRRSGAWPTVGKWDKGLKFKK